MIDLAQYRTQLTELCQELSVKNLEMVRSAARENFDPKYSDIDVLIEFQGKDNLFHRYFDLKFGLEKLFGRTVDVIQESAIENPWKKIESGFMESIIPKHIMMTCSKAKVQSCPNRSKPILF